MLVFMSNVFFFSASIFAYGQTSSGKTYTMTGITEYSVSDIYDYIEKVSYRNLFGYFTVISLFHMIVLIVA